MKNILKVTACLLSALLLSTSAMAADYWTDKVVVNAGYGAATIDGVYNADEWATAEEIAITLDDATVKTYGVYQGAWESARDAKDFSTKMYFMWDEEALYICEVRLDDYVELNGTGATPWGGADGNLIFLQAADGGSSENPEAWSHHIFYIAGDGTSTATYGGDPWVRLNDGSSNTQETVQFKEIKAVAAPIDGGSSENPEAWSHHIFYIAGDGTSTGTYGGDPWVRLCDGSSNTQETVQFKEIKAVAAPIDGGFCVEIMVPWSVINDKIPDFIPEADVEVGMSMVPIDFDEGGEFAQLCWVNQADALGVQGGYDYGGWATMVLNAAPVVETEAEVVDAVVDAPAAAPQTFDAGVIAAVAAIVSAAGYAISKKR